MTVYLVFFFLLAATAFLMELNLTRRSRLALFLFAYIVLVVFVGLRWETGNDWTEYFEFYTHTTTLHNNPSRFDSFEIGYRCFNICMRHLGLPYAGFLLVYSATYLGFMFLSFRRENYAISGWLALQLYAPLLIGLMGTSRQVMAVSICMFSVRYLLSREWLKFLLCIGVATTFHISAPAFLVAWPVSRLRLSLRRVVALLIVLAALVVFHVGALVTQIAGALLLKFNAANLASHFWLEQESSPTQFVSAMGDRTIWTMVVRIGTLLAFLLSYRLFTEETDRLYFKLYLTGLCIVFLFSGSLYVLSDRVAIYFTIYQIHLLALLTRRLKRRFVREAYCVLLVAVCLSRLYTSLYLIDPQIFIPYKGVLINRDVKRDLGWFRNDF